MANCGDGAVKEHKLSSPSSSEDANPEYWPAVSDHTVLWQRADSACPVCEEVRAITEAAYWWVSVPAARRDLGV